MSYLPYPPPQPPRSSAWKPAIVSASVVGGILVLVVALVALCGFGSAVKNMDEKRRCAAAGTQQGVKTRWTESDGCTKRGILGIRVPVEY